MAFSQMGEGEQIGVNFRTSSAYSLPRSITFHTIDVDYGSTSKAQLEFMVFLVFQLRWEVRTVHCTRIQICDMNIADFFRSALPSDTNY
jgi:hypothetical protein